MASVHASVLRCIAVEKTETVYPSDAPTSLPSAVPSISVAPTKTIEALVMIDEDKNPIALLDGHSLDVGANTDDVGVLALVQMFPTVTCFFVVALRTS